MTKVSNMGILVMAGMRPHEVSKVLGCKPETVEDYMDAHMRAEHEAQQHYESVEKNQVNREIKLWLEEFPEEWKNERRAEGLRTEIARTLKAFQDGCKWWATVEDKTFGTNVRAQLQELETHLNRLQMKAKVLMGKEVGITPEQIVAARSFPIGNLIKNVRGMALCPFHTDKTPSMDCRKNFYHCYGCGAHGDVITLVMKLENLTFVQAIKRLT